MWDRKRATVPQMGQLRKRLAVAIRERRGERTLREFASRYGLSPSSVQRMEAEEQNVTIDTLEHLCRIFRCEVGDLFPKV